MMIMEYVENGSLKNYLDQTRVSGGRVPDSRLIAIAIDIAKVKCQLVNFHVVVQKYDEMLIYCTPYP